MHNLCHCTVVYNMKGHTKFQIKVAVTGHAWTNLLQWFTEGYFSTWKIISMNTFALDILNKIPVFPFILLMTVQAYRLLGQYFVDIGKQYFPASAIHKMPCFPLQWLVSISTECKAIADWSLWVHVLIWVKATRDNSELLHSTQFHNSSMDSSSDLQTNIYRVILTTKFWEKTEPKLHGQSSQCVGFYIVSWGNPMFNTNTLGWDEGYQRVKKCILSQTDFSMKIQNTLVCV